MILVDVYIGCALDLGYIIDLGYELLAPTSASRAIPAVAELLVSIYYLLSGSYT